MHILKLLEINGAIVFQTGCVQCPACKTIYGEKTGVCPPGTMEYRTISQSLSGHPDCATIQIVYNIERGLQVHTLTVACTALSFLTLQYFC